MSFAVVLSPEAEEDLGKLPPLVASYVLDELDRLAANPGGLRRPSHFPYLPGAQAFHCEPYEHEGVRYFPYVQFKYGQDEQSLYILFIAMPHRP